MTELEKAIAEVKRGNETFDQATLVLRAVVSGELVPAAERDADVAVTVKPLVWDDGGSAEFPLRAEGYWIDNPKHDYAVLHANGRLFGNGPSNIVFRGSQACQQAKGAAQADALARVRSEAVTAKPLVWKPVYSSGNYSRSIASGEYRINEVGLCGWELLMNENSKGVYETCDSAKAAAQAADAIRAAIGGVE